MALAAMPVDVMAPEAILAEVIAFEAMAAAVMAPEPHAVPPACTAFTPSCAVLVETAAAAISSRSTPADGSTAKVEVAPGFVAQFGAMVATFVPPLYAVQSRTWPTPVPPVRNIQEPL